MSGQRPADPPRVDVLVGRAIRSNSDGTDSGPSLSCESGCFERHHVEWCDTRICRTGRRMIYRFRAHDAESVRIALRSTGIDYDEIWVEGVTAQRPV